MAIIRWRQQASMTIRSSGGAKRTGPDLARVGGRYSDDWQVAHLTDPQSVVPQSAMPKYGFLNHRELEVDHVADLVATHRLVGAPYSDEMLTNAAADFAVQIDPDGDSEGLLARYPGAQVRSFDGQHGVSAKDALMALDLLCHDHLGSGLYHRLSGMADAFRGDQGLLGYSTRAELAAEIKAAGDANAAVSARLVAADLTAIAADPAVQGYAASAGAAVFRTNCMQCHGAGAGGVKAKGYRNLLDDDWLWGGHIEAIHTTISHGIRNTSDPNARFSLMPAWGNLLEPVQIDQLVQSVLQINGQQHDAARPPKGPGSSLKTTLACRALGLTARATASLGLRT